MAQVTVVVELDALIGLAETEEEKAPVREVFLGLLSRQPGSHLSEQLAAGLARLDPADAPDSHSMGDDFAWGSMGGQRRSLAELTDRTYLGQGDVAGKQSRFWIPLGLAAVIASAGVVTNATAAVIGAMIIAPLGTAGAIPRIPAASGCPLVAVCPRHIERGSRHPFFQFRWHIGRCIHSPPYKR